MRILCATDLLPKSEVAIERTALLSAELRADVELLHVVSPTDSPQALEQTLQRAFERTKSRAEPLLSRTHRPAIAAVRVGNPARIIVEAAAQSRASLLVLGPHHKRPLRDALEGTIAEKVLATRKHPVLVVRDEAKKPYRRVLLALDSSDASVSAIRAAESLVLKPDVKAVVVHAHNHPYRDMLRIAEVGEHTAARYMREWKREATCTVRDLLRLESDDAERYHIHIEQKHATPGILQAVERFSPDLIVMGAHGGGRLRRALVGSVANRVLRETSCDVLIVPEGSFGASRSKLVLGARRPRGASVELSGAHSRVNKRGQEVENVAKISG
jgi:nucleotide-binding universal stress UspA family protein